MFRPAFGCAQQPKAGQNTKQTSFSLRAGERRKEEKGLGFSSMNIDFLDLDWTYFFE